MARKRPVTLTAIILTVAVIVVLYLNSHAGHNFHGEEHAAAGSYPEAKTFIQEYNQDIDPVEREKPSKKTNPFVWTDEEVFWPGEQILVNHDFSSHPTRSARTWVALMRADEKMPVRSFDIKEPVGKGSFSVDHKGNYVIRAFSGEQGEQIGDDVHVTVDVIAEVSHGKVQGKTIVSNDKKKTVFAFPSVQYGVIDPRKKFGLAKARKYKPGIETTNFAAPGCFQDPLDRPDIPKTKEMSVNCLYLSVYTFSRRTNVPVIVYIHGGNYEGGNQKFYNGARLAASQKIVVVSINYRLGAFGSLYLPGTNALGNQMLSDSVLALQWVQKNIRRFGGNPKKVTIMGQSAGGTSVIALMASSIPKKSLFQHVIAFSAPLSLPSQTPKSWKKWISKLNEKSGCRARGLHSVHGNRRLLACLNRMNPLAVIRAQNRTKEHFIKQRDKTMIRDMSKMNWAPAMTSAQPWTITVGVKHPVVSFKKEIMDILKECGNRGKNAYELMIGYCKDDFFEWSPMEASKFGRGIGLRAFGLINGKGKIFLRKRYKCKLKGGQHCLEKFGNLLTDGVFRCPSLAAALSTSPGKAYLYHMKEHPSFGKFLPFKKEQCWHKKKNLICHGCLLPYVWNMNGFIKGVQADPKEEKLIKIVQRAIGHFAYHGKPPQSGKHKWPAISNERDNVAVFERPFHIDRGQPEFRDCNPWFGENVKGFAMRKPGVCGVGKASNFLGFGGQCSKACRKKGFASPVETGHSKGSGYWLCGAKGRAGVNINKNKKSRRPASSRSSGRRSSPRRSSSRRSSPRRSSPRRSSPRRSPPRQRSSRKRPSRRRRSCYANGALTLAQDENGEDIPMEDVQATDEEVETMQVAEPDEETSELMAVPDRWTSRWVRIPGRLTNVAVSSRGSIYGVNRYHHIWVKRAYNRGKWRRLRGRLTQISVNTAGTIVTGVNRARQIWYTRVNVRNLGAVRWTNVPGRLVDVTSGRTFMYGVNSHDHIYRANLMKRNWCRLPGALKQISAHGTKVVGVNRGGRVYQYLGYGRWRHIRAPRARWASMGRDGDLWVIATNQWIYRLVGGRFRRIYGALVQIDVADKNNVVGVNRNGQIYAFVSKRLARPRPRSPSSSGSGSASEERESGESASRDEMVNKDIGKWLKKKAKKLKKKAKKGWNKLKKKTKKHVKKFKKTVKKHVKKIKKHAKKFVKTVKKHVKKVVNKIKNFFGKYTCKVPGKGTKLRFDCFCETVKNQVKQIRSRGTSCGVVCRRANKFAVLVSKGRHGWNYGCCASPGPGCKGGTNFAGRGRTICRTDKGNMRTFMCLCY